MDGLECSEINFREAIIGSYSSRLDSDFFTKDAIEFSLISKGWDKLSTICPNIKSGTTPSIRDENLREGIALLKTNDIRNNIINPLAKEQFFYIDEQTNKKMESTSVKNKDVLINIVGASTDVIGRVSFIPNEFIRSNVTQAMAILRIENASFLPEYLFAFLLGSFAKKQTNRIARQTGQFNMNLKEVGDYRIWKASSQFQLIIAKIVNVANKNQMKAQRSYQEGQEVISKLFSVTNDAANQNISIRNMSLCCGGSTRLDAEYYQTKYDEYAHAVSVHTGGCVKIRDKFQPVKTKCLRNLNKYHYVEIGDVNVENGSSESNIIATEALPDNAKIMTQKGDIIISTVRPNRGAVSILESNNLLVSGAFIVLRQSGNYPKEILQVLLRTEIYRDWLLKYNVGTSYPVIKDDDVLNMPIPLFDSKVQNQVIQMIKESQECRQQSELLLETAKRAVEIAIEQGEDEATEWLKEKGVEC